MAESTEHRRRRLWGAIAGAIVLVATATGIMISIRGPVPALRPVLRAGSPGHSPTSRAGGSKDSTTRAAPALAGRIVFANRRPDGPYHLHVIDVDGMVETELTSGPADERGPSWSPDGTLIAFSRQTRRADASVTAHIYVMNADGTGIRRVTHGRRAEEDPSWSPDGIRIVFSALDPATGTARLSVTKLDGTGATILSAPPRGCSDREPAWSPDGSKIAFVRKCGEDASSLYIMNADGTGILLLTTFGRTPDWSPDGGKIAYTGEGDAGPAVFVINSDGTAKSQLTREFSADPSWSPDGTRIAFTGSDLVELNLFVISIDGTGMRRLTAGHSDSVAASW